MVILILAAGYAVRLHPYTLNVPKPLLTLGDRPMLDYILERAEALPDISDIIIVTNNRFYGQLEEWRKKGGNPLIRVINDGTDSVETRLGAVGDIRFAIKACGVNDDLTVIAGDNLFTYELNDMYAFFKSVGRDCICVKRLEDSEALKSLGVCVLDEKNKVVGFKEKPKKPESNIAVYATYMFKKETLPLFDSFFAEAGAGKRDAPGYFIEWLYKNTDVYAWLMNGDCRDIGTVEAYERARRTFPSL